MNSPRLLVQTTHLTVRWGDMDTLGHVNNTNYFRYMEQARIEWVYAQAQAHAGTPYDGGQGPVIVNASCDFLVPLVYPADIVVTMYLGQPGRTSAGSYYEIHSGGTKVATGAAKLVWINVATGRPVPMPEALAASLRALAG
jgi:acyl-CoA thioester hydrolase